MQIKQNFVTLNPCYRTNRKITPKGIMLHSTACPGVMADKWFSRWNNATTEKCVHAFLDDKIVSQLLPWNHRGWHCAGAGNNTHIGFEMCEPKDYKDATYFNAAWANAVELCVMLCKQYGLTEKNILSHAEGYKKGIASNHGDPDHWWKYQGKTMDDFRKAVYDALNKKDDEMVTKAKIEVNGKTIEVERIMKNDTNYVKLRDLADALGAKVSYDAKRDMPVIGL